MLCTSLNTWLPVIEISVNRLRLSETPCSNIASRIADHNGPPFDLGRRNRWYREVCRDGDHHAARKGEQGRRKRWPSNGHREAKRVGRQDQCTGGTQAVYGSELFQIEGGA
jgi:hypothetical protein